LVAARFRILAAFAALIVIAAVATGCGGGVPGNGVARIDDAVIKKSTFDHWLTIAAKSSNPNPGAKVVIAKPPDFDDCVKAKRDELKKAPKGQPKQSTGQLKAACKQEYEGERDQVMQFLISNEWLKGEAADQGVKVSQKEVDKEYEKQKKQSFPKPAEFAKFLKSSGYAIDDLKLRVTQDLITTKLRTKIQKVPSPSEAEIRSYYDKHQSEYTKPETRDLQVVLAKTKAKADEARQRLDSGEAFKSVSKALSIDQASSPP
jgi:foldase protein PrsA